MTRRQPDHATEVCYLAFLTFFWGGFKGVLALKKYYYFLLF
jgi:hypothetical protein